MPDLVAPPRPVRIVAQFDDDQGATVFTEHADATRRYHCGRITVDAAAELAMTLSDEASLPVEFIPVATLALEPVADDDDEVPAGADAARR